MKSLKLFWVISLCFFYPATSAAQDLRALLDKIWQYELSVSPILATRYGVHDFDHLLTDVSEQGLANKDKQYRNFLAELKRIDSSRLNKTEQISLLMQKYRLQNYLDKYQFKAHYFPLTSESGFYSKLVFLPRTSHFNNKQDYHNYLTRLEQFPTYFSQQINWMKKGIESGLTQPKVVLKGVENSVQGFIHADVAGSVFYAPFLNMKGTLSEAEKHMLLERANKVISSKVFTAYQSLYDFLTQEYIPNSKDNIAAKSWPNGLAYYQNRSDYFTTTSLPVEKIHQLGLTEVKRIRNEMQQVIDNLEFDGDIQQFIAYLRSDPRFYAKTAEELIVHASFIAKKMDAKLPQLFNLLPRTPYGVEQVPSSIAPKYTTGRYISPTRDDQPGFYWVNTYALDKRPLYALTALTLHEAVPGHHLQISLAREMKDLPEVRRYTYISAFGEGWGLYSEFLGKEVGMYEDPYDEFGRLSYEMWRACRLVVDTGMHVKDWSRQQAVKFMLENTALSEHNVMTEIDRYISWPGQALSYKMGELTIKKLRKHAEDSLGKEFDLRAFHNAVLEHGSVPLSVLEANIQEFVQQH